MRAAPREEISKGNEWKIYDFVTRHFIASLSDDLEYVERRVVVNLEGYNFQYIYHEITERGFMTVTPWKLRSMGLNENRLHAGQLREGARVSIRNFDTVTEYTKAPDYLQESELIALMDEHGIGTDASIPQHIKNICERHYVDVCGPIGENGEKGQIIQVNKNWGKNRGRGGQQPQQQRPMSRHMVPRGFGLAFLSCFEELDKELCEPRIRAFMEQQVTKIATGETEKNEVVDSTLRLFFDKFMNFRANLGRCDRYFAPKGQGGQGGGAWGGHDGGGGRGGHDGGGGRGGNNAGGRGGFGGDGGGRGGFEGGRGGQGRGGFGRGGGRGSYQRGGGRGGEGSGGFKRHQGDFGPDQDRWAKRGGRGGH